MFNCCRDKNRNNKTFDTAVCVKSTEKFFILWLRKYYGACEKLHKKLILSIFEGSLLRKCNFGVLENRHVWRSKAGGKREKSRTPLQDKCLE